MLQAQKFKKAVQKNINAVNELQIKDLLIVYQNMLNVFHRYFKEKQTVFLARKNLILAIIRPDTLM